MINENKHFEVTYKVNGMIVKVLAVSIDEDCVIDNFHQYEPHSTLISVFEVDSEYRNPKWND